VGHQSKILEVKLKRDGFRMLKLKGQDPTTSKDSQRVRVRQQVCKILTKEKKKGNLKRPVDRCWTVKEKGGLTQGVGKKPKGN